MRSVAKIEPVRALLDLLYPPLGRCLVCDRRLPQGRADGAAPGLCPSCHLLMTDHPEMCPLCGGAVPPHRQGAGSLGHQCEPGDGGPVHYAGLYRGALKSLIDRYRSGRVHLVHTLAYLLAQTLGQVTGAGGRWALVPVPPDPGRTRGGPDGGALLARRAAGYLGVQHLNLLSVRPQGRGPSPVPPADGRFSLGSGRSRLNRAGVKNLVVVDDICTTGVTLRAATAALRRGFAGSIRSAVVAAASARAPVWPLGTRHNVLSWSKHRQ